jgi:hypothetical protein
MKTAGWSLWLCTVVLTTCTPSSQAAFNFGYKTVFDSHAGDYIVSAIGVKRYSEWQSPPVTYWGPSANNVQGLLTYRFDFAAPTASIYLDASLASFNFIWGNAHGYFGSGTGSSSLWGSADGASWQLLLDNPVPTNSVDSYLGYHQNVPSSLLGSLSFWVQIRMTVDGAPNTSYTTAQFSRSTTANPDNVFNISVANVPEPPVLEAIPLLATLGLIFRQRIKHHLNNL